LAAGEGSRAIDFRHNEGGGELFHGLTTRNRPSGGTRRRIALVVAGQVMTAPFLAPPIRRDCQVTGSFSDQEVAEVLMIMRAGIVAWRLEPGPPVKSVVRPKE